MKTAIIAFILLISVLALVIANSIMLSNAIDEISKGIKALYVSDSDVAYQELTKIYDVFKGKRGFIGLTVNHNDITSIEASFSELMGAALADDTDTLTIVKSRLIGELSHLRRLSGINLDSIL